MRRFAFFRQLKANHQPRLLSFVLRLSRLTSHFLLLIFFFALPAFSQPGWERTFGGAGGDQGYSVQQTTDGGYIIAGWTSSFGAGNADVYLIKTNASGDTLWTRTYGGPGYEGGWSVQQTTDGGYIIAGETDSWGAGGRDVYLIKTNASGDTLWAKTYGGPTDDEGYSVQQTLEGGYIVAGYTTSFGAGDPDVYLIKTNALGDTLWTKTYGGSGYDGAYSVCQTSDSGYILTGWTDSFGHGRTDVYLIKTNANGDTLWTRTYGGTTWDEGNSVQQTSDGNYIIAGSTQGFGYLLKVNQQGDTLWTRAPGGGWDWAYSVQQTTDGGYIITGRTSADGGLTNKVYLVKTDSIGGLLWIRSYGGTGGDDEGQSVQQTSDGGYIIAGFTNASGAGGYDVYLIKTDSLGKVSGVEESPSSRLTPYVSRLTVSPNPFTSFATVPGHFSERFAVYDISGRKVGIYKGDRVGSDLSAGVYFLCPEGRGAKPLRIVKFR